MTRRHKNDGTDNFLAAEDGASTVEFVVMLPFLIALLGLIASASLYLAVASDVQQLAHELARAALPVADDADWCDTVQDRMVAPLADNLPLLSPERVTGVQCGHDATTGILSISVNYDTRGTLGAILGSAIGLRFDSFQRASFVQW